MKIKWPFVLRKTRDREIHEYYLHGYTDGQDETLKDNAFKLFDKTTKFIDAHSPRTPITKEWSVSAEYVLLLNHKKNTVYAGKLSPRVYYPGDTLNLHFTHKGVK